jgi:hypothetical protein
MRALRKGQAESFYFGHPLKLTLLPPRCNSNYFGYKLKLEGN